MPLTQMNTGGGGGGMGISGYKNRTQTWKFPKILVSKNAIKPQKDPSLFQSPVWKKPKTYWIFYHMIYDQSRYFQSSKISCQFYLCPILREKRFTVGLVEQQPGAALLSGVVVHPRRRAVVVVQLLRQLLQLLFRESSFVLLILARRSWRSWCS